MRRRDFIGVMMAVGAWPLAARAQHTGSTKRIAVLMGNTEEADQGRLASFRQALKELNWVEGRNVVVDVRFGGGNADLINGFAGELVALAPDVILATNTPTARSLKQATTIIPVVFSGLADPIADGIVTSLSKPEGNITGFTSFS